MGKLSYTQPSQSSSVISDKIQWTEVEYESYNYRSIYWSESYQKGDSHFGIRGSYPKWNGFRNKAFQDEVNLAILESLKTFQGYDERPSMHSIDSMRSEYISRSDAYLNDLCVNDDVFPNFHLAISFSYSVSLLTPDFISIIFLCYHVIGTAGAYETAYTMNIDIKNEKIMRQPSTLFSTSIYWSYLKPLFLDRLKALYPSIESAKVDDEWLSWDSIRQNISFAFTPSNFLIIYNENETYSMEKRYIISIPYKEVIHLLNPNFVNLKQWQNAYSYFTSMKDWSSFTFFDPNNMVFGYLIKYPNACKTNIDSEKGQITIEIPSKLAKVTILYNDKKQSLENDKTDLIRFHGDSYEMTEFRNTSNIILSARERNILVNIEYMASITDDSIQEINKILSTIRSF